MYRFCVVNPKPIYQLDSSEFPTHISKNSRKMRKILVILFDELDDALGSTFADEARETLYAEITSVISSVFFLKTVYVWLPAFETSLDVRKFNVHIDRWPAEEGDVFWIGRKKIVDKPNKALRMLLRCPNLQYLELSFCGPARNEAEAGSTEGPSLIVFIKEEHADLLKKLGNRLKIMERWYVYYEP